MPQLRTERRYGVTSQLSSGERSRLSDLINSDGWPVLLDVLEQSVIEMETSLINTSVADESAILSNHKKVQAAWQMFEHMQTKAYAEVAAYERDMAPQPAPRVTQEEAELLQVTEPFNEYSAEASEE